MYCCTITQRQASAYALVAKNIYSYMQVGSLMGITAQAAWKLADKAEKVVRGGLIASVDTEGSSHPSKATRKDNRSLDLRLDEKAIAWLPDPYTVLEWAIDTKTRNYICCGKPVEQRGASFWCDMCGRWSDGADLYTGWADPVIMREFW